MNKKDFKIDEIKTICSCCGKKKAIINCRIDSDGKIITKGEQVEIGGNEKYKPLCRTCYKNNI
jgi:thymidine kinase